MVVACLAGDGGAHTASIEAQRLTQAAERLVEQPVNAGGDAAIAHQLAGLRQAMAEMQATMARGGWGRVSPGAKLEPGMRDPRVSELRYRLTGGWRELAEQPELDSAFYDPSLAILVKQFQSQHGLTPDGAVGPATLTALNRSPEHRLGQLMIAFDKIRQQAPAGDAPRLRVNLPAFTLEIHEGGVVTSSMAVVVGRPDRPTPQFSSRINLITLNPSWTVPTKLASEDLLPKLRRNPDLLIKQGFFAYRGPAGSEPVSLSSVDWSGVSKTRLPYWFRQEPGQRNSLGRYKMSMPNDQDIYLHDTPDRHLFARDNRALSSGCIRVSRPAELAAWLLRHNTGWSAGLIGATLDTGLTTHILLNRGAPVLLDYQTAWVDSSGAVQYREDIYGLDTHSLTRLLSVFDGQPSAAISPTGRQP